jgi:catechol 2,3-dioxygenase-like lactoylglutathione lyase family enzyme
LPWIVCRLALAILGLTGIASTAPADAKIAGLDHIPIAVNDLEAAADRYRSFGFVLKPGRPHDNGIRNQHVKFPDGTELELITAPAARDALTQTYRQHLAVGDGPTFLALYAPELAGSRERLKDLDYIFFGTRNHSPTDRPEHFAHPNTADSLISVWLAGADLSGERRLLESLGARLEVRDVLVPDAVTATVARLPEGQVVFLPRDRQLVPDRRIVGATVRVRDLGVARRTLERLPAAAGAVKSSSNGSRVFLPPSLTHGIWLELCECR